MQKRNRKVTVTAHTLVKNEENFIWYAIMSVLPYVDKMIVFDTGSTDKTVPIIKKILKTKEGKQKIHFEEKGEVDKQGHTDLRNEMIKMTKTDWFMILDGDEVWPEDQISYLISKEIVLCQFIDKNAILVNFHLASLDLHHYTELGHYSYSWGLHSNLMPRFFKKEQGLKFTGEYGEDKLVIGDSDLLNQEVVYISTSYFWHLSKLERSSRDSLVFARSKSRNLKFLPNFVRKLFVKRVEKIPDILLEYERK